MVEMIDGNPFAVQIRTIWNRRTLERSRTKFLMPLEVNLQNAIPGQKLHSDRPGEITTKSARSRSREMTTKIFSSASEFDREFIVHFRLDGEQSFLSSL
jgi:hypothetical protein